MKSLSKTLLSLLMVVSLTACSSTGSTTSTDTPSTNESTVTDGEYTATATGFGNGEVSVTLTVENGEITNAVVDTTSQSEGYGADASEGLASQIVEKQSYDLDVVSGATVTRDAVSDATKQAMEQAGFTTESTETVGEDQTANADVLVIGMGASGTMAALKAAESGATVIGVEATASLGGFGNAAQGMFAINSVEQEERYGEDGLTTDEDYWYDHMSSHNNQRGNNKLIRTFVSEAKNTVSYLLNHGVKMFLSPTAQQIAHFDTDVVYHRWNNADPFTHLGAALEENNVDIRYNTTATELIVDENGKVTGAKCTTEDGGTLTVTANSTIVATGSFASNAELMEEVLGKTVYSNANVMAGTPLPGVEMMWNVGAARGDLLTMNHGVNAGATVTVDQLTLNSPILWVNNQGKRFMNEDLLKDTVEFTDAVVAQGGTCYTIVDQTTVDRWTDMSQENTGTWVHYWDRFGIVDENGNPSIYHAPIDIETWNADFETLAAANEGGVFDTIEEAAEFIGCNPADLQETIDNYNSYVQTGVDEEFFKSSESLIYTVSEGPYYVTKGHAGVLGALGGVNTNEKLQVLNDQYEVIDGLYSTGNNVSGISFGSYQDVEGVGLGFSLTSGRLAGGYAAEVAGYEVVEDTTALTEVGQTTMEEATTATISGH